MDQQNNSNLGADTSNKNKVSLLAIIEEFVERLMKEKGIPDLGLEEWNNTKQELMDLLQEKINLSILQAMPEERADEFDEILETGTGEDIHTYCQANITNYNQIVAGATEQFRTLYLND